MSWVRDGTGTPVLVTSLTGKRAYVLVCRTWTVYLCVETGDRYTGLGTRKVHWYTKMVTGVKSLGRGTVHRCLGVGRL